MQENTTCEFKREFTNDINKEVIAFANTEGGKIFIGIEDDGTIIGVSEIDKVMQACVNHIHNTIRPDLISIVKCSSVMIEGKPVLEIEVRKGTAVPYYIAEKGLRPEGVYVRIGSVSVPATETVIRNMIKNTDGTTYEDIRALNQNLTFEEADRYFAQKGISFGELQKRSLGLINSDGLYTNLGLLLSDECTHTVKIAVFDGIEKETFRDRYEFTGSLFRQITESYAFIDRYNRTQSTFRGLERVDKRDFPVEALREALLNCIVHREYALSGSTLIHIFDDRIEFISLGGLPKGIEYDDMMLGVSMPRNKKLANLFYRLRLIEAYGTGISKIMRSYKDFFEKPLIEVTNNAFKLTLPSAIAVENRVLEDNAHFDTVMLLFDKTSQITRGDVEQALNVSRATAARILAKLVSQKRILRFGNTRNTKYIKTE